MKNFVFILFLTFAFGCKKELQKTENKLKDDVAFLADDKLEGRQTGTKGGKVAANYIAKRFKDLGLLPKGTNNYLQAFTFKPKAHPHAKVEFTDDTKATNVTTGHNVVGFMDNHAENTVIIGAHFDHLGYGIEGSLYRGKEKLIHNGADDNASGVAVMLHLISKLKNLKSNNNFLFIAFSGEEMGLLGSNYFTKHATIDLKKANYMLNMDMVGRLKKDTTLAVYGVGTSSIFKKIVQDDNKDKFHLILKESGVGPSDHTSFYLSDIPVLHFFTGQHADYHKPTDDFDKLNYKGMETITDYIFNIIADLNDDGKLTFQKTKNETQKGRKFKVTLGVIPDYMYDGKGMKLDGISEDKPAQKAGLQKGDIVMQLGDSTIVDMMSYVRTLGTFKKGDTAKVIVKRNGKKVAKEVTF